MAYEEPTLKQTLYEILNGLQSEKNLRETGEGLQRLRQSIPGVAESITRGAVASVPGSVGDISEFARTVAPETMESTFGNRVAPTTREILDYVPRITPTHEGATTLEDVGAAISPGVGGLVKDTALLTRDMPAGLMMVGPKSKLWNKQMEEGAKLLEKQKASPEQIWEATGMVCGPDKKWRTEISDQFSKMKENSLLQDKKWATDKNFSNFGALYNSDHMAPWGKVHLKDVFQHPELEKAYPHLFDKNGLNGIKVKLAPEDARYMGRVEDEGRTISIRPDVSIEDARRIFNHELQHVVQKHEGFATGGSPDTYTQQADAKLAREALAVRREAERMDENVNWHNRVHGSYVLHRGLGMDLSPEVLKVAENRIMNPTKDMENLTMLYGTDKNIEPASPLRMYEKIAGEAEARLTENRMNLSNEERQANYPYKWTPRTYDEKLQPRPILGLDVPLQEQIVHGHKPNTIDIGGKRIFGEPDVNSPEAYDYRGAHKAPGNDDYHSPAHELDRGMYPEDVYGPNGHHYYGTGNNKMDREVLATLREARGNPDHPITVYRAVPSEFKDQDINPGDWVTPSMDYAHQHGLGWDSHHIIEKTVPAKHLWSEGNSLHEFGYDPTE